MLGQAFSVNVIIPMFSNMIVLLKVPAVDKLSRMMLSGYLIYIFYEPKIFRQDCH